MTEAVDFQHHIKLKRQHIYHLCLTKNTNQDLHFFDMLKIDCLKKNWSGPGKMTIRESYLCCEVQKIVVIFPYILLRKKQGQKIYISKLTNCEV